MNQEPISLPDAVKSCFRKYFSCRGRASRGEYWWFSFFSFLVFFTIMMIVNRNTSIEVSENIFGGLQLFFFFPLWAVSVRRLHDTNRSGWWMLLLFTIIGIPLLFFFFCLPSEKRINDFGSIPCTSPHIFGEENQEKKRVVYSADTMDRFDRHGE